MGLDTPEMLTKYTKNNLCIKLASLHNYMEMNSQHNIKNVVIILCVLVYLYYLAIPYTYRLFVVASSYIQLRVLYRQINLSFIISHTFTVSPKVNSISGFLLSEICLINIKFRDLTIYPFRTFRTVHAEINAVKCCLINTRRNPLNLYSPSVHRNEYEWNKDFRVSLTQQ